MKLNQPVKRREKMDYGRIKMLIRNLFIVLFIQLFLYTLCVSQDIESKVDEFINAHMKNGNFNGSILIAKNGRILVSKGYGYANMEHNVLNTPQTKFRLGSITKQFTSMAIMQLQEKDMLSVNDPLTKFIPDYPGGDEISVHHLLTHTSGVPNLTSFPDYRKTMMIPVSIEEVIDRFKNKSPDFSPGEKFSYSNSGYILLGYIVKKVSGKSYENFIKENIFTPLHMEGTGYDHHNTIIKNRASGYEKRGNEFVNAAYIDMVIPHGAGALYSTVEDLYTWDRALYTEKLVKKSTLEKIFTPFKGNYAYGWGIGEKFNRNFIGHGGGINGFVTNIGRFVDDDACVIVLSNVMNRLVGKIGDDLAAILFGEEYVIPEGN